MGFTIDEWSYGKNSFYPVQIAKLDSDPTLLGGIPAPRSTIGVLDLGDIVKYFQKNRKKQTP